MDTANRRAEHRQRWVSSAAGWYARRESFRTLTMPVSSWLVEAIAPQPGQTVLELAAGVGDVGFLAADLIAPGGTLICSDFVPEMLTAAQQRAAELQVSNVRFRQIDAESIDLDAASVDAVLCRWGFMLLNDPEAALRQTRRVLKSGGRLALAAWTSPDDNLWAALAQRELIRMGISEPVAPGQPGPFAWADKRLLVSNLEAAGFTEYQVDSVSFEMRHPSFDDWWHARAEMSSEFGSTLAGIEQPKRAELEAQLRTRAADFAQPDGSLVFPARTWVAVARA